uniref:Solute carrier family 26 member 6, like n=1 Tax=Echeneis naucrates TaxID=173247 RepID=A0A665TE57_ECHNA
MDSAHRLGKYRVEREVLDEQRLEEVTLRKLKRRVLSILPILYWLPKYSVWDYGMPDLISGISVWLMHCWLPYLLYLDSILPSIQAEQMIIMTINNNIHLLLCSGTFTVLSIMVGSVTERLAPDLYFLKVNETNITAEVDTVARDSYRVQVAAATTVLGGLIQVVLGLVKFGFVGTYLSEPLVRAYTTAAAAHAVVAQLKYIFGVSPTRFSGPLSLVYTLRDVCSLLPQTHLPTLLVSAVSMVFLVAAKELNSFLSPKLPVPIPVELITVTFIIYLSYSFFMLIDLILYLCARLSPPEVPDVTIFGEVIGDAFALAIVGYAISISLGKTFALKHGYKVDSNQELVALGLSNVVGGFFQCYSVCPSMSRSLVQETTGGKTQMAGVASALIVFVTILKLGPLFQELPKAVLAVIVFVNLKGMFKQYTDVVTLWRRNKIDLVVWLVTWVSTLLLNLDLGLAASITFALLTVIFRTQIEIPGVTIFRSSATVYFANAELYLEALKEKSGLDISKMIIYKRRQEAKQKRRERRAKRRAKSAADGPCRWEYLKGGDPDCSSLGWLSELQDGDTTTLGSSSEDTLSRDLERVSLGSLGKWTWDIHSIILDLSTANFIDTVAIKTMKNIFHDFSEIDVDIYMAASVVEQLELGDFFSESITKRRLFTTVHDAVLYCLNHPLNNPTSICQFNKSTKLV